MPTANQQASGSLVNNRRASPSRSCSASTSVHESDPATHDAPRTDFTTTPPPTCPSAYHRVCQSNLILAVKDAGPCGAGFERICIIVRWAAIERGTSSCRSSPVTHLANRRRRFVDRPWPTDVKLGADRHGPSCLLNIHGRRRDTTDRPSRGAPAPRLTRSGARFAICAVN